MGILCAALQRFLRLALLGSAAYYRHDRRYGRHLARHRVLRLRVRRLHLRRSSWFGSESLLQDSVYRSSLFINAAQRSAATSCQLLITVMACCILTSCASVAAHLDGGEMGTFYNQSIDVSVTPLSSTSSTPTSTKSLSSSLSSLSSSSSSSSSYPLTLSTVTPSPLTTVMQPVASFAVATVEEQGDVSDKDPTANLAVALLTKVTSNITTATPLRANRAREQLVVGDNGGEAADRLRLQRDKRFPPPAVSYAPSYIGVMMTSSLLNVRSPLYMSPSFRFATATNSPSSSRFQPSFSSTNCTDIPLSSSRFPLSSLSSFSQRFQCLALNSATINDTCKLRRLADRTRRLLDLRFSFCSHVPLQRALANDAISMHNGSSCRQALSALNRLDNVARHRYTQFATAIAKFDCEDRSWGQWPCSHCLVSGCKHALPQEMFGCKIACNCVQLSALRINRSNSFFYVCMPLNFRFASKLAL